MILHCTPPYNQQIPNPALGYLKGFLQSRGIEVKNVYWNIVLANALSTFRRKVARYLEKKDPSFMYHALYLGRKLLEKDVCDSVTPLDVAYQSVYSNQELAEMVHSVHDEIDLYIKQHNLCEVLLHGFTAKTVQWLIGYSIIRRLKEMNPSTTIVMGGITTKSQAKAFMKTFNLVDYVIWGEGEYPLLYLTAALEKGTLEEVPNLVYRENSKIVHTTFFQEHLPLDSYPFADHSDYVDTFQKYMTGPALSDYLQIYKQCSSNHIPMIIPIWGSRACPWNRCRFCALNEEYTYRTRSPENIIEEIEFQYQKYHAKDFFFVDTELPGNPKRFKSILKLLMKIQASHERKFKFYAEISPIFITEETARYMQLASFSEIQIGFEAMTDSLLEKMEKRHHFAHNIQALKLGDRHGLTMHGLNVIRGIPTETKEDIIESCTNLRFLRFFLHRHVLIPISLRLDKGAPFYNDVSAQEREEWMHNPVYAEIEPLHLIPEEDKFEFMGFYRPIQNHLWDEYGDLMKFYAQQSHVYDWVEYEDGSFVEENGLKAYRYIFDRAETDLFIFCDEVRSFSDVKEQFPHMHEEELREMLRTMKDVGLIYYDEDMHSIISVLDATKRKLLVTE